MDNLGPFPVFIKCYNRGMSQQLIDYVVGQVKAGVPLEQVRAALSGAGWSEADVNEAMKGIGGGVSSQTAAPLQPQVATQPEAQEAVSAGSALFAPAEERKVHHISLSTVILSVVIVLSNTRRRNGGSFPIRW